MRKHDHLVEPLFGALRHHGPEEPSAPARTLRRRRALAGLVAGALVLAALYLLA